MGLSGYLIPGQLTGHAGNIKSLSSKGKGNGMKELQEFLQEEW